MFIRLFSGKIGVRPCCASGTLVDLAHDMAQFGQDQPFHGQLDRTGGAGHGEDSSTADRPGYGPAEHGGRADIFGEAQQPENLSEARQRLVQQRGYGLIGGVTGGNACPSGQKHSFDAGMYRAFVDQLPDILIIILDNGTADYGITGGFQQTLDQRPSGVRIDGPGIRDRYDVASD